jgi:hypothetical protein
VPLSSAKYLVDAFVRPDAKGPARQRRWYLALCVLVFVPTALVFFTLDYRAGRLDEALPGGVTLASLVVVLLLNRVAADMRWAYRLAACALVALLTWVVYVGAAAGYAFVWFYLLPPPLYYIFGRREGSIWFVVSLLLPLAILVLAVGHAYPPEIGVRFGVTCGIVGVLSLGLWQSRSHIYDQLVAEKHELEIALGQVRTLRSMLPMCAWCRRVKDPEGRWLRIEEVLDREAGTRVSHGMCPDCGARQEAADARD